MSDAGSLAANRLCGKTLIERLTREPANMRASRTDSGSNECSFAGLERQRLARCRLLAELRYRRLPHPGGWGHCGKQFGTEPTSLALLALHSSSSCPAVPRQELEPLLGCQRPNGIWPAVGNGTAGVSFWSSAVAVNTLMILGVIQRRSPGRSTVWLIAGRWRLHGSSV